MIDRLKETPLLLALVASTIFFFNLGGSLLWDDDEPKNASCGREMLERGDWTVPTYNAELRPHKPILLYWGMIASYKLVGVSEFGARMPSALASIGTVLLCFYLGRKLYDQSVGFTSGLLLASGLMFAVLSRAATPDAVLILCSTAAFLFFVHGMSALRGGHFSGDIGEQGDLSRGAAQLPLRPALGMYAAIGLAVLAKGPIGVLLPMSVIGLYCLLTGGTSNEMAADDSSLWKKCWLQCRRIFAPANVWRVVMGLRLVMGAAVVAAVALPWYVAVTIATEGQWLTGFLGTHNVHRFLHPMEGHGGPIFYYVIAIMAGFFPASCFLPVAIVGAVRDHRKGKPAAHSHAFLLIWICCYLVFFSLAATKLPNYIVPCYPALALLTGFWLVNAVREKSWHRFWLKLGTASCAVVGLALAIGLGTAAVMFLDADWIVAVAGIVPLVGGIACLVLLNKQKDQHALNAFVATCVLFTIVALGISAPRVSPYQTSPRIAQHLLDIEADSAGVPTKFATFGYTKPNIVFYSGKPVPRLNSDEQALSFLESAEPGYVVMPEKVYDNLRPQLADNVTALRTEPKFFKPDQKVVVVGRSEQFARRATSTK